MYLFPTDGSDVARQVESVLEELLDPDGAELAVLVVIEDAPNPFGNPKNKANYETKLIERAEEIAESAARRLGNAGFETRTEVLHGDAGPVICDYAEDKDVERIVMGRRGLGAVGELLLGSVSHYVIHHAPCPLTVVPYTE